MEHDPRYLTLDPPWPNREEDSPRAPEQTDDQPQRQVFDHLTDRELFARLGWFISIRWVAGILALVLVMFAVFRFSVPIPPRPVVLTICGMFLYNAFFLMLVTDAYRRRRVSRRFITGCGNAQMICDLITFAVLAHFTGGVENDFLVFFVCPLIVVSELLSARNAYGHAALAALLIHGVAWSEYAGLLPHVPVGAALGNEVYRNAVAVTTFTVALSALLFAVVFLNSSIASRLHQRERELEKAYDDLSRLEESKSFAMRKTSHELRAPLNAVVAMLQVIKAETDAEQHEHLNRFVDRALSRTRSLSKLIEELHRYALLRAAGHTMRRQRVDLAEVVSQNVSLFSPMAREKSIDLRVSIGPVHVEGDPEALSKVTGNLIVNAIQYTPPTGSIHVSLEGADGFAHLKVTDTGIGIPPGDIDRVFDEFYRTQNAKKVFSDGTGMGLPIVRRIVETHGGRILVTSTPGRGTTFAVSLPYSASSNPDHPAGPDAC